MKLCSSSLSSNHRLKLKRQPKARIAPEQTPAAARLFPEHLNNVSYKFLVAEKLPKDLFIIGAYPHMPLKTLPSCLTIRWQLMAMASVAYTDMVRQVYVHISIPNIHSYPKCKTRKLESLRKWRTARSLRYPSWRDVFLTYCKLVKALKAPLWNQHHSCILVKMGHALLCSWSAGRK